MIYFTSDLHFNHPNIIQSCRRPFANIQEHNQVLIDKWNAVVGPKDEIYVLGDFACADSGEDVQDFAGRLNGKKYLLLGNNDEPALYEGFSFVWVKDYHVLTAEGIRWVLCHYPIWIWDERNKGTIHLYGHVHNHGLRADSPAEFRALADRTDCINVGVDVNGFAPVSVLELARRVHAVTEAAKPATRTQSTGGRSFPTSQA